MRTVWIVSRQSYDDVMDTCCCATEEIAQREAERMRKQIPAKERNRPIPHERVNVYTLDLIEQ